MKGLTAFVTVAYPFVVFAGLHWLSPRMLAAVVGLFLLIRGIMRLRRLAWREVAPIVGGMATVAALVGLAALLDDGRYFKFVPVAVNVGLLVAFARTLIHGPSMVESLARLHYESVPAEHLPYCYRVTVIWSVFFALNALFTLWLAIAASLAAWTLYTGLVAYLLAGTLFAAEVIYRAWRFRHYGGGPVDAMLRRVFPPRVTA